MLKYRAVLSYPNALSEPKQQFFNTIEAAEAWGKSIIQSLSMEHKKISSVIINEMREVPIKMIASAPENVDVVLVPRK